LDTISIALAAQFDRNWEMWRATIARFSDDEWRTAPRDRMLPVRWAYHAIQTVDFYMGENPESFDWETRADWGGDLCQLPNQKELLAYIDAMQAKIHQRLDSANDEEMLRPTAFPWTGHSLLQQMLYLLRHTQYHLGELAMLLRLRGDNEAEWL
jgi:hypothetical protein